MTGSDWSFLGVAFSVVGTLIAAYGSRLSSQEAKSRGDQLVVKSEEVATKTAEVAAKSDQLALKSDEIANLNRENADLSKRFAAYAMGTDSYVYLHIQRFGETSRTALFKHVGPNPIRDTEILIFNITDRIADLATQRTKKLVEDDATPQRVMLQALYPITERKLGQPAFEGNPTKDSYAYFVYISGPSATYRQVIQLVKVGDTWKQAYRIDKVAAAGRFEPVGLYFDQGFPTEGELIVRPNAHFPQLP